MPDVFATYSFIPQKGTSPEDAARWIAEEETTGTWTRIGTTAEYVRRLDGEVTGITPGEGHYVTKIRYPAEIFEPGNVAQYLSVVAGNLFGLKRLDAVRLIDMDFPESLIPFPGPKFGIRGIRAIVGTTNRPHVGTIIKPKVGLSPDDTAEVAYQAAVGGVDLIKDDETLTDQAFCPIRERVPKVMAGLTKVKEETGRNVLYAVNVTARADKIVEKAEEAIALGANMVMVDVIIAGFGALQALGEAPGVTVPIHVHRAMHAAMTRNREHGVAMRPFARLVRWLGGDQLPHRHRLGEDEPRGRGGARGQRYPHRPVLREEEDISRLERGAPPGEGLCRARDAGDRYRAPGRRRYPWAPRRDGGRGDGHAPGGGRLHGRDTPRRARETAL